jgi:molecular chaperone DnaK (HSP70)
VVIPVVERQPATLLEVVAVIQVVAPPIVAAVGAALAAAVRTDKASSICSSGFND